MLSFLSFSVPFPANIEMQYCHLLLTGGYAADLNARDIWKAGWVSRFSGRGSSSRKDWKDLFSSPASGFFSSKFYWLQSSTVFPGQKAQKVLQWPCKIQSQFNPLNVNDLKSWVFPAARPFRPHIIPPFFSTHTILPRLTETNISTFRLVFGIDPIHTFPSGETLQPGITVVVSLKGQIYLVFVK